MSIQNPYYRSVQDYDDQFAQDLPEANKAYHSAYNYPHMSQAPQPPSFSSINYPSVPQYHPVQPQKKQQEPNNYFVSLIQKFRNKRNNNDLSSNSLCKNCKQMTESFVVKKNSFVVWILCIFLLVTTYVCFFLPFLFDALKNKHVICKNCGKAKFVIKVL